jgi:zinc ribbon protein
VPDFCTCGAQLPPDARFCHKCGKPQYDYPGLTEETAASAPPPLPAAPVQTPLEISFHNRLAVRIGFLAALTAVLLFMFPLPFPLLRLLLAFLAAGFLAVFAYTRRTGQMLSIRSGARMGWITGVFSFTFVTILFTAAMVAISNEGGLMKFFRSQLPPNDARTEKLAQALSDPAGLAGMLVFSVIVMFIILTVLPVLGGALGAKVLAKE